MAEFEQIVLGFRMRLEQLQQRIRQAGAQILGNEGASALTADQQPAGGQLLHRFTHRRSGDLELGRQLSLRRQALARLERPFENHGFQLLHDHIRYAGLFDALVHTYDNDYLLVDN